MSEHRISPDSAPALGERIKRLRQSAGLKQSAFVGELVSSGYISLIEQGKRLPSAEVLAHIAKVLEIEISDLLAPDENDNRDEQGALVARAEALLTMKDYESAAKVVTQFSAHTMNSRIGKIVQAEIDFALGNFVAGELICTNLIDEAIDAEDWSITRRAILTYGRISNRINSTLESTIFLAETRRRLLKLPNVDPLLMAQLTASIADRYLLLGDVASARKLLDDLDELLPQVSDNRARASALWVQSTSAYESGNFELAITLAREAQELFSTGSDPIPQRVLQIIRLQIVVLCVSDDDPRLIAALAEIDQGLAGSENSTNILDDHLLLTKADLLTKIGRDDEAKEMYLQILDQGKEDIEQTAHIYCQLGRIMFKYGNLQAAEDYLEQSVSLIRASEIVPSTRRLLLRLAEVFELLGNNHRALAVLKLTYKPVSDLSLLNRE